MPETDREYEITLEKGELTRLAHLGAETEFEDMEPEDAEACRAFGLLFAENYALADYVHEIEQVRMSTRVGEDGEPLPPLASVDVIHGGTHWVLTTGDDGKLPPLPFRKRR